MSLFRRDPGRTVLKAAAKSVRKEANRTGPPCEDILGAQTDHAVDRHGVCKKCSTRIM